MPSSNAPDDAYLTRLDKAIDDYRIRIRGTLVAAPLVAGAMSALAFMMSHPGITGERGADPLGDAVSKWYRWSQGWASAAEAGTVSLGLLTAALTLYVATTLAGLDHDRTSPAGVAARLLLDDVTLAVCLAGSVACWLLSAGAGWTPAHALGSATAAATAVVLTLLAGCAETRQLAADRERWSLERAQTRLTERLGAHAATGDVPSWVRTFPWRSAAALALVAALPATIRIGFRFPHEAVGVVVAAALVVLIWLAVVCASWSWWCDLRAAQVRYRRPLPTEAGATGVFALMLVALVAVGTVDLGDEWGVLSLVLLTLAMVAPVVTDVGAGLRRRGLLRHLTAVRTSLAEHPSALDEPPPQHPDPVLTWSLEIGRLRVQRFSPPDAGEPTARPAR